MRRSSVPAAFLGLAWLFLPGWSFAYQVKHASSGQPVHWGARPVLSWAPTGDKHRDHLLEHALEGAAKAWRAATGFEIEIGPPVDAQVEYVADGPNLNVVRWSEGEWPHEPDMLALTFVRYEVDSGAIVDADILINDAGYKWTDRMEGDGGYDLQNALTHEIGHAIGLAHSEIASATMFASTANNEVTKRDLDADDIAATSSLYAAMPAEAVPESATAGPSGGCRAAGPATPAAAWSCLALLASGAIARRRRRSLAIAVGIVAIASAATVRAAPEVPRRFEAAVARADAVLEAKVVAQHVEARGDLIVTHSELVLSNCVAGSCPSTIAIEQLGGEIAGRGLDVAGSEPFAVGERVMIAARHEGNRWVAIDLGAPGRRIEQTRGGVEVLRSRALAAWQRR